jgi:hypothetical protein
MARKDKVVAKGLGVLKTYWLDTQSKFEFTGGSNESGLASQLNRLNPSSKANTLKHERLIHWMTDVLSVYMKNIVSASVIDCICESGMQFFN